MTTLPRGLWLPWGRRPGPEPGECTSLQASSPSRPGFALWGARREHRCSPAGPEEAPPAEVGPGWRLQSSPGGWGGGAGPPRRLWVIIVKDSNVNENIKAIFKFCFY